MDEELKKLMGDAYKEGMTSDEIQAFFKNQILGGGNYVNKEMADANEKKLKEQLESINKQLQDKMTDDEKKAASEKALQEQFENMKKQLLEGKINNSKYRAISATAKGRLNAGIADDDNEFSEFISKIATEDETETLKIANYVNSIIKKAYEKGKSDATKNKLGNMGNFKGSDGADGGNDGKTMAEQIAERLAKSTTAKKENGYFK